MKIKAVEKMKNKHKIIDVIIRGLLGVDQSQ